MENPELLLRVTGASGCPTVRPGDRWIVSRQEIAGLNGARLCPEAIHRFYPRLAEWLETAPAAGEVWRCQSAGCEAAFAVVPGGESGAENGACRTRRSENAGTLAQAAGSFMSRLSPELALEIVAVAGRRQGEPGAEFVSAGVRGERLLIVAEGQVEVVRVCERERTETVLALLGPGDCFGEMSLLTDHPTSATVRARTSCTLFTLTRPQLERLLNRSPELARVFSQLLAERLRALNRTLESEMGRGMRGRLSTLSFGDLVQVLHAGRRSGLLTLSGPGREARLFFAAGRLLAAQSGALHGPEAFFDVAFWKEGEFRMEDVAPRLPEEARIDADTIALLMEAMRRMDEGERAEREKPGAGS